MSDNVIIRASSLSGYVDCPRRTAARLFKGEIEGAGYKLKPNRSNIGGIVGTATHVGAIGSLEDKIKTGELGNKSEAEDRAIQSLRKSVKEEEEGLAWDTTAPDTNAAEKQTIALLDTCREQVLPSIQPEAVEYRLEAQIAEGLTLSGQADVRKVGGVIGDLKTGKIRRANNPQYGAYSLLARSHGIEINGMEEYYVKRVKVGKEQPPAEIHQYDYAASEQAAQAITKRIQKDLEDFRGNGQERWAFLPNPGSMLCSPKYCPAFGTDFCKEHKQEK